MYFVPRQATRKESKRGFTLIELLVVIAIIGLLSSVVMASLNTAREKARDTRRLADVRQLQLALDLYASSNGGYYPHVSSYVYYLEASLVPNYMPALPEDPSRTGGYRYRYYAGGANSTVYTILIDMEDDGDNTFCRINMGAGYSGWQSYPSCI